MKLPTITSAEDLAALVEEIGFLPFFPCGIEGFSVEACTPPELWFSDGVDGPWEWKGPVITQTGCAYGKLFSGKAGYVSKSWYADFANVRRGSMDFEERYEMGLIAHSTRPVYETLRKHGSSLLSRDLRWMSGCDKKAYDAIVTRLQMQAYVVTVDFEYQIDRMGRPYGWGLARYDLPERHFGTDFTESVKRRTPEQSRQRIFEHLEKLWPNATEKQLSRLIEA